MAAYNILRSGSVVGVLNSLTYNGEYMGDRSVTSTLTLNSVFDFNVRDYIVYHGETFELDVKPTPKKLSTIEFVYDLQFLPKQRLLKYCDFLDIVLGGTVPYTGLNTFSFFGTVSDLKDRIQANLNKLYTGGDAWTVSLGSGFTQLIASGEVTLEYKNVEVSNIKCWDALLLVDSLFGLNFSVTGTTITIVPNAVTTGVFAYGKGNGLYEIDKVIDESKPIINRLRAFGGTTNFDPITIGGQYMPNVPLPAFSAENPDPYLEDATSQSIYGIREGVVYFDGSNGNEDIHPSIKGMQYKDVHGGSSTSPLDVVVAATVFPSTDTGEIPDNANVDRTLYTSAAYNVTYSETLTEIDNIGISLPVESIVINPDVTKSHIISTPQIGYDIFGTSAKVQVYLRRTDLDTLSISDTLIQEIIHDTGLFASGTIPSYDIEKTAGNYRYSMIVTIFQYAVHIPAKGETQLEYYTTAFIAAGQTLSSRSVVASVSSVFDITLPNIGFDIAKYLSDEGAATISLTSGACGGYDFSIVKGSVSRDGENYSMKCVRVEDSGLLYPNYNAQISAGDTYVFLNIALPEAYITYAKNKLYNAADAYLDTVSNPTIIYTPKIDEIYMAKNPLIGEGLREGMQFKFEDSQLGIAENTAITIQNLSITEGSTPVPTYDVTLSQNKPSTALGDIQKQIKSNSTSLAISNLPQTKFSSTLVSTSLSDMERLDLTSKQLTINQDSVFLTTTYNTIIANPTITTEDKEAIEIIKQGIDGLGGYDAIFENINDEIDEILDKGEITLEDRARVNQKLLDYTAAYAAYSAEISNITGSNSHAHTNITQLNTFSAADVNVLDHFFVSGSTLYTDLNFYSLGSNAAYGLGSSYGGGAITNVYGSSHLGDTFDDGDLTETFNAYTIKYINGRFVNYALLHGDEGVDFYAAKMTADEYVENGVSLTSKYEAKITAGTLGQYYRGDKTWQSLTTDAVAEGTPKFVHYPTLSEGKYLRDDGSWAEVSLVLRHNQLMGLNDDAGFLHISSTEKGHYEAVYTNVTELSTGYIPYKTAAYFGNSPVFTDGTNMGIGTNNPERALHIKTNEASSGASLLQLDNSGTASNEVGIDFYTSASNGGRYPTGRIYGKWDGSSYATSRLTLQSSTAGGLVDTLSIKDGNVGIGYSSGTEINSYKFAVNGSGFFNGTVSATTAILSNLTASKLVYTDANKNLVSGTGASNQFVKGDGSLDSATYEASLGNPSVNGFLLSSTTDGVRSWVEPYSHPDYSIPTGIGGTLGHIKASERAAWNLLNTLFERKGSGTELDPYVIEAKYAFYSLYSNAAYGLGTSGGGGLTKESDPIFLASPAYGITATKITNWDIAYTHSQNTTTAVHGATTLGYNLLKISNPSAITFPRFNADNSVSSLSASDFRTAAGLRIGIDILAYRTFGTAANNNTGDFEAYCGVPSVNGYLLSSTTAGVRSWVAPYSHPDYSIETGIGGTLGHIKASERAAWNLLNTLFERKGSGTELDPYVIEAKYAFYSLYSNAAYGLGTSGGGGGAVANLLTSSHLGDAFTDDTQSGNAFNAYTVQYINNRFDDYIPLSSIGVAYGVAELDETGKIISSQLPSYVDDVIEVATYSALPATGESGKIYITQNDNKTYRWTGSGYAEISSSLALGETSSTAYRGDRGAVAYAHTLLTNNPHSVTISQIGAASSTDLTNHINATGTSVHGLGSAALKSDTYFALLAGSASQAFNAWGYRFYGYSTAAVGVVTTNAACYSLSDDSVTYGYGISTNAVGGLDIMANQQGQKIRLWAGTPNNNPTQVAYFSNGAAWVNGSFTASSYIQATTAKFTNLGTGYLPYHISDANGLGDSPVFTDGTNVGIGTDTPNAKLHIVKNNSLKLLIDGTEISNMGGQDYVMAYINGSNITHWASDVYGVKIIGPNILWNGYIQKAAALYVKAGTSDYGNPNYALYAEGNGNYTYAAAFMNGNVGIGYSSGSEINSYKLAVNGSGFFNGNLTSSAYYIGSRQMVSNYSWGGDNTNVWLGGATNSSVTGSAGYEGNYLVAIGVNALRSNTTGNLNNAIGVNALYSNTTGYYNNAIGVEAGRYTSTGDNAASSASVYLGYNTKALADGDTNEIVIGHEAVGHGSNTATWGNTSVTNHYFAGDATFSGTFLQIGGAKLVWDATNNALKVIGSDNSTAVNFYATGSNAAYGLGTSGGGGLTEESDPIFLASPAHGITATKITNWDAAYTFVVSGGDLNADFNADIMTANSFVKVGGTASQFLKANGSVDANTYVITTDSRLSNARPASDVYSWAKAATKPTYTYTEVGAEAAGAANAFMLDHVNGYNHGNIANGQTAYGWGNHASAGYLTSVPDASTTVKGIMYLGASGGAATYNHNHSGVYEPAITKSTGFLKWSGSAWSWDTNTYVTGTPWTSMGYLTAGTLPVASNSVAGIVSTTNQIFGGTKTFRHGIVSNNTTSGTSPISEFIGVKDYIIHSAACNVSFMYGFKSTVSVTSSATISNRYGFYVSEVDTAIPNNVVMQYGFYCEELTKGYDGVYAIYTAGSTPSYFGGNVSAASFTENGTALASKYAAIADKFPGFGTSHTTAAYGDHTHGYWTAADASTTVKGIMYLGASGGAATYGHNHNSTYAALAGSASQNFNANEFIAGGSDGVKYTESGVYSILQGENMVSYDQVNGVLTIEWQTNIPTLVLNGQTVSFGANNSGGTGYRVLVVPNA